MKYYIITGESSGDMHAANLVKELKNKDNNTVIRAWGGERLISEGVSIVKNINTTNFMGIWNVLKNFRTIKANVELCKQDILRFKPDALILVDYAGFNLRIAQFAKKSGLKVFFYISPKVWAWNKSRISKIKKYVDHLLVIFPFEVDFYQKYGVEALYIGNPLLDELEKKNHSFSLKSSKPIIALLPGSRKQEIESILPEMLKIVTIFPKYQFIIAANNIYTKEYYKTIIKEIDVECVFNETYGLLLNSKAALVTSGTATLEAALLKVPQVVCYKTNWLTYIISKALIKIEYLSLVNILLEKEVVKELIQSELNKENISMELNNVLNGRDSINKSYNKLIKLLNKKGASENAANFIIDTIS